MDFFCTNAFPSRFKFDDSCLRKYDKSPYRLFKTTKDVDINENEITDVRTHSKKQQFIQTQRSYKSQLNTSNSFVKTNEYFNTSHQMLPRGDKENENNKVSTLLNQSNQNKIPSMPKLKQTNQRLSKIISETKKVEPQNFLQQQQNNSKKWHNFLNYLSILKNKSFHVQRQSGLLQEANKKLFQFKMKENAWDRLQQLNEVSELQQQLPRISYHRNAIIKDLQQELAIEDQTKFQQLITALKLIISSLEQIYRQVQSMQKVISIIKNVIQNKLLSSNKQEVIDIFFDKTGNLFLHSEEENDFIFGYPIELFVKKFLGDNKKQKEIKLYLISEMNQIGSYLKEYLLMKEVNKVKDLEINIIESYKNVRDAQGEAQRTFKQTKKLHQLKQISSFSFQNQNFRSLMESLNKYELLNEKLPGISKESRTLTEVLEKVVFNLSYENATLFEQKVGFQQNKYNQ